jgi:hypothetical protein
MTRETKIGQTTLVAAGRLATGSRIPGDPMAAIRVRGIGAIGYLRDLAETRKAQRVAVEDRHRLS